MDASSDYGGCYGVCVVYFDGDVDVDVDLSWLGALNPPSTFCQLDILRCQTWVSSLGGPAALHHLPISDHGRATRSRSRCPSRLRWTPDSPTDVCWTPYFQKHVYSPLDLLYLHKMVPRCAVSLSAEELNLAVSDGVLRSGG